MTSDKEIIYHHIRANDKTMFADLIQMTKRDEKVMVKCLSDLETEGRIEFKKREGWKIK